LIGILLLGCGHAPAEKPRTQPGKSSAAPPSAAPPDLPAPPTPAEATRRVDFARDVRPILESRCQPCHFAGGRMYERLPFDRPQTVRELGPKLFSRIKDEGSQRTIRAFLSQGG
jgi:hypothetical protein